MILHIDHHRWREFYVRLNDILIKRKGCKHNLKNTRHILSSMKDIDVDETIQYFMESKGTCDCRVLSNIFYREPKPERYYFKKRRKKNNKKITQEEYIERQKRQKKWKKSRGGIWY